jgi:galactose-6-phosphate isomerase
MPSLNVTRVLFSREFVDRTLIRRSNTQTVDSSGIASNASVDTPFAGVVTNDAGSILKRFPEASIVTGSMMVHSRLPLSPGAAGHDADLVQWLGNFYTVTDLSDWTTYGAGFTAALCTPLTLQGT